MAPLSLPIAELKPQLRPLTRRALFTEAFAALDKPYGLGGTEGGLDCSGLLLDLFDAARALVDAPQLAREIGRQRGERATRRAPLGLVQHLIRGVEHGPE